MPARLPRTDRAMMLNRRSCVLLGCALSPIPGTTAVLSQEPGPDRTESVRYLNTADSTELAAALALPTGDGPHAGVVLLSVAGTTPLVERLVDEGYAVLTPTLRGFVEVEPLLAASYADLAGDVRQALTYLGARPEVDAGALGLIAQGDNAPLAMLVAASEPSIPLVLLAPPALPGPDAFRLEQRWIAERAGAGAGDLAALDRYVAGISEIVRSGSAPYTKEARLRGLRAGSRVDLPPNAAFPSDERQAHFFASPFWHDRLGFEPERALARLSAPVLVLVGAEEPYTPMDDYLSAVRRGLAAGTVEDATVCRVPGRTRHTFSTEAVSALTEWLAARLPAAVRDLRGGAEADPSACLEPGSSPEPPA